MIAKDVARGAVERLWGLAHEWIRNHCRAGHLFVPQLLREANKRVYRDILEKLGRSGVIDDRPASLSPRELVEAHPEAFTAGKEPCGRRRLRSQAWREGHLAHCQLCLEAWQNAEGEGVMETRSVSAGADAPARNGDRPARPRQAGKIAPNCYMNRLLKTIEWGWAPSPREAEYKRLNWRSFDDQNAIARAERNGTAAVPFRRSLTAAVEELVASGVVKEVSPAESRRNPVLINPVNMVLKNSDIVRARMLYGIDLVDDDSVQRADARLAERGERKIKLRPVFDMRKSGLNSCFAPVPYRAHDLSGATEGMRKDGFLFSVDISSYYHHFAISQEFSYACAFIFNGRLYRFLYAPFGMASAPIYCLAFSSELRLQLRAQHGITLASCMDDFLGTAGSEAEAKERVDLIVAAAHARGLKVAAEKVVIGQQLAFAGVTFCTKDMRLSMSKEQALSAARLVDLMLARIGRAWRDEELWKELHSLVGRLQWKSQVLVQGSARLWGLWRLVTFKGDTSPSTVQLAIQELTWWSNTLHGWAQGDLSLNRPVFSPLALQSDPQRVMVVVTDASGDQSEGGGGFWGPLSTTGNRRWLSFSWDGSGQGARRLDSSAHAELWTVLRLLRAATAEPQKARQPRLVFVIVDASSAAYALNKGRVGGGSSADMQQVMTDITDLLATHYMVLIALWVPRDHNAIADSLSHLSASLSLALIRGPCVETDFH